MSRAPRVPEVVAVVSSVGSDQGDRLMSVKEAAEVLQVSAYMVRQWARERRIPAIRMGDRYWRFRRSSLDAWIAEQERAAR